MKWLVWAAALSAAVSTAGWAQCKVDAPTDGTGARTNRWDGVGAGMRVRLVAPSVRSDPFVGRIDGLPRDSVRIDTSAVQRRVSFDAGPVLVDELRCVTLPRDQITQIDVSRGRAHLKTTLMGVVLGGVGVGAFSGLMSRNDQAATPNSSFGDAFRGGAILGSVVGGVIGYLWGRERWVRVR